MTEAIRRTPIPFEQASALVTGGTSGVGLETACQLAEAGVSRIAIVGRNAERGQAAREAVLSRKPGVQVEFLQGDCNEADQAIAVCEAARAAFGSVDILVNSTVGPYGPTLLHNIPVEQLQDIVLKQMMAPLLTSRIVLPWMSEKGGGAIVNIASDAGKLTTPGESVIGAAMAGIIMFSRTMAIEAKRNGIRVNIVTPSIIEGTATYQQVMAAEFSSKLFGKAIKMAQLGVVTPADMAALIVFLASPQAAKITGQAISCNGGISAA
ncbi:MAG TPA: SDR family oxidoreductase [Paracoccus solventivorans]|uniref:SDR family oxidoreductase n=1 Tax=Paracoccus solventivorans TaxID=53463 RepID=A0A832PKQ3_9RHOB|nr:SDR family oxidoreductase [Paracoccus solventivorans]HHW32901.1 SDR family oxidoreductase [Paracoccus solventivorans]